MSISQYFKWLKRDWAKAGLLISIFFFILLFVFVRKENFVIFILLLQTPLYMLHQTEEYVFPGGFGEFFNKYIFGIATGDGPLDQNFIFYINILLIWVLLPICGLLSLIDYQFGLWLPYFSFFAGIAHILLAIKARKLYNPGLVISLILNIPIGLWAIVFLIDSGELPNFVLNPHFFIGLGINALLPMLGVITFRNYKRKEIAK